MDDFERAKDKIMMGAERRSMVMSEEERRTTAYHEAGHAVVGKLMPRSDPVHKVTIIPRGLALGLTMYLPEKDRYGYDREFLLTAHLHSVRRTDRGGSVPESDDDRCLERLRAGHPGRAGHGDSLWHVRRDGSMVYGENDSEVFVGRSITTHKNMSEATLQKVDRRGSQDHRPAIRDRAQADRGQPRQGRGHGQSAARARNP